jgi:FKBP-type peptidyl-prolyl cis-trans isomerase
MNFRLSYPGIFAMIVVAFSLVGCGPDAPPPRTAESAAEFTPSTAAPEPVAQTYADTLGVDLSQMELQSSGLYRRDLEIGDGQFVTPGDRVSVHYAGWLPDGTQFDKSAEPFDFEVGSPRLISGWNEGVIGMREGGRRLLVMPPNLGYGAEGSPPVIPPNATLVFEMRLLEIH